MPNLQGGVKPPLIVTLNFSGGGASTALLSMVLDGTIPMPVPLERFHVIIADPGMEDPRTYVIVDRMEARCLAAGIKFHRAPGRSLAFDLLHSQTIAAIAAPDSDPDRPGRLDLPPYWTLDPETGKRGRLIQRCTQEYKIRPMDRVVRRILEEDHGIPRNRKRIGARIVEKWVGFSADESHRVKPDRSRPKYQYMRYPLIEHGITKAGIRAHFDAKGEEHPPRSVCAACFANGARYFLEMAEERPEHFDLACRIDESIRDLSHLGVKHPCYVSRACRPLREVVEAALGESENDMELGFMCNSGECMT